METAKKKLFTYLKENNLTDSSRLEMAWDFVSQAVSEESEDFPTIRNNFASHHHDVVIEIVKSLIPKNGNSSTKKSKEKAPDEPVEAPPLEEAPAKKDS